MPKPHLVAKAGDAIFSLRYWRIIIRKRKAISAGATNRMVVCSKCHTENQPQARFCYMCAQPLAQASKPQEEAEPDRSALSNRSTVLYLNPTSPRKCPVCEAMNAPEYVYCQDCGSNLQESRLSVNVPTVITANPPPVAPAQSPTRASASADHLKTDLPSVLKRVCPKCGNAVGDDSLFCNRCGTQLPASRTVAMSSIKSAPRHRLVLIVDGQETDEEFDLNDENIIGRLKGDIT